MGTPKKETTNHIQLKNGVDTYGRVVLTLKNCLLPEEKLSPTPSQIDGLDAETETDLRILGCELMQTAGILLKLPQVAMATAQVLFHRFYYSKSFVRQNFEITGMGCLYLASKIEEAPRRIRDVINVYHHIKQVNNQNLGKDTFSKSTANIYVVLVLILDLWCVICGRYQGIVSEPEDFVLWVLMRTITPMVLDQNYINLKYQVIKAERRVLKELGFCVHVKHPHKLIVMYLQVLGLERKQTLMQLAWNYMNDSLRTDVFVRYQPETVACACMYLTARRLKIAMPKSPPWYSIFNVEEKDIQDICLRILRLYSRPKPKAEVLEKKVQELCKKFEENRLKNKTVFSNATSGTNTPTSPSVVEKKPSPKRRSNSDRSRSRSRSASVSPRHKKAKKHKRSTSRSRSRSRSYEKKYKKSHKNNRRSRSSSPSSKNHKDKKYRSRSRSYEREYKKLPNDGKYYSDRYKEEKGFDRYYKDEKFRSKDEEKYRKDDEKYRKEEKGSSKEEDRHKKEDKHKRNEENYRKEYKEETYKNSDKNYDEDYKEERKVKYKNDDKYSREVRYLSDKSSKNDKYEEKERYNSEKYSSKEKHKSTRSDKYNSKDSEYVSKDENYGSKKDKYESDRKRKHKHRSDDEDEEDDDIEIIAVKREKKSR